MGHIIREVNEIDMHPNNIKKEDSLCLRQSWKPLISFLNDCGQLPYRILHSAS
jgi:hypothetical protein